ncbi:F-box/kelch-repeat protein, partial [Mucuna pruriens]
MTNNSKQEELGNKMGVRRRKKTVLLPRELIIKILLRLPVKSLVRFKCVCKWWLSLISDPHFTISHFELAAERSHRLVLLEPSAGEFLSIDFNASLHDYSASASLNLNFLPPESYYIQILGSCRGFLLLELNDTLCVWNPSTGVHKQVPLSPIASHLDAIYFTFLYGFGYDPSTDDYLVLQASYDPSTDDHLVLDPTRVEFFSLRANAWKEIQGMHLSYMNCCDDIKLGLFFKGAIHWLAFRSDVSMNVILAFDLTERSFSEIPLPLDFECQFEFCDLRVIGEFLSLCLMGCYSSPAEIWVMEEYKVQSSWTKSIVVSVDDIPIPFFSLICFTKSGDIVGTDGRTGLVKCDDKGQLQEHRSYCSGQIAFHVAVYTESLLSLPFDSEKAEEDN